MFTPDCGFIAPYCLVLVTDRFKIGALRIVAFNCVKIECGRQGEVGIPGQRLFMWKALNFERPL